jgi:phosphatidylethanolamine/phosphatidyl-N-methylethanolamine N-methyltransferase
LAAAVAACIRPDETGAIVELGGGTGSITRAILDTGRVQPENLVVIEREARLCAIIANRCPGAQVICGDAGDLGKLLKRAGVSKVRTIISGLPFLSMPDADNRRIIDASFAALAEDGEFIQFTYGPASPIPKAIQSAYDLTGQRLGWILMNIPAAAVWLYRRTADAGRERDAKARLKAA